MKSPRKLLCHALLVTTATLGAQIHTWEQKANGQVLYDCDPANDPGGEFYAPSNSNWSQEQVIGDHPCTGDPGFLRQPSNWNTPNYPDSPVASVLIDSGPPVLVDVSVSVGSLQITGGNSVLLPQNSTLSVHNSIINDGTIEIDDDGGNYFIATLEVAGNVNLTGSGTILFKGHDDNRLTSVGATSVLTIGANQLLVTSSVTVAGDAHSRLQAAFTNNGTIRADQGGLQIDTHPKTNNNVIEAVNGGHLVFRNTSLDNALGTVTAATGCTIDLDNASFSGGTLAGEGTYDVLNGDATFDGSANALTFDSTAILDTNQTLTLRGTVLNEGTIHLNATGVGAADLRIDGNVTLNGTGQVLFESEDDNYITSANPGDTLTIGANQSLITSAIAVGSNNNSRVTAAFTNNGTITADQGGLQIDTHPKTNNSLIQAVNGGHLKFDNVTVDNAMGTITATAGSTMTLSATTLSGGIVNGGGIIDVTASNATFDGSVDPLTFDSTITAGSGQQLTLKGTINNNGIINLNDVGANYAHLRIDGNVALNGTGQVRFVSNDDNYLISSDPGDILTIGPDQELITSDISIAGSSRSKVTAAITNNGTITADQGGLQLDTHPKTNPGLIRTLNGGTMRLHEVALDNTAGTIMIDPAGTLELHDSTITGGLIDGEGAIVINNAPGTLHDLTIGPDVTADIPNNRILKLAGTVTNNGTITIADTGSGQARMQVSGNVSLGGTGTIVFNTTRQNYLESIDPADTLTVLAGQAITTSPDAEVGQSQLQATLVNHSVVEARIGSLTLDVNPKTNNGTFRAVDGGELEIRSAGTILTNYEATTGTLTDGRWEVLANGSPTTMDLQGAVITTVAPGTEVILSGAGASFPALVNNLDTNEGHLALHDGLSFTTVGDFASSGKLEFGLPHVSPTTWDATLLDVDGHVNLTGCVIDITDIGMTNGRYRIINYSGSLTGTPTLGSVPAGLHCSLDTSPTGSIDLVVTGAPVPDPVILDFDYDPTTNTATITYQSIDGETYGILGGTAPDSLFSLGDTATGDGSIMQHTDHPAGSPGGYFYQMTR